MTMAETSKERTGPLPNWLWAVMVFVIAAGYLIYRKKNQMNQQAAAPTGNTNLGTTPISNLTTQVVPMPNVAGDTFINVTTPSSSTPSTPSNPLNPPATPSSSLGTGTNPAAPTPTQTVPQTSSPQYAGWTYIPTYQEFQAMLKSGKTIDWSVNGGPLQPYFSGGKQVGSPPPANSRWYYSG